MAELPKFTPKQKLEAALMAQRLFASEGVATLLGSDGRLWVDPRSPTELGAGGVVFIDAVFDRLDVDAAVKSGPKHRQNPEVIP